MKVIQTNAAPAAIGPYTQAYERRGLVFTSGQIPLSREFFIEQIEKRGRR